MAGNVKGPGPELDNLKHKIRHFYQIMESFFKIGFRQHFSCFEMMHSYLSMRLWVHVLCEPSNPCNLILVWYIYVKLQFDLIVFCVGVKILVWLSFSWLISVSVIVQCVLINFVNYGTGRKLDIALCLGAALPQAQAGRAEGGKWVESVHCTPSRWQTTLWKKTHCLSPVQSDSVDSDFDIDFCFHRCVF